MDRESHLHICVICLKEWEHHDKRCVWEAGGYLECEACMTFTFAHPCPKCGTASEELQYGGYSVTRCVCPNCRHYFAPPGQKIYAAEERVPCNSICPRCGTHAASNVCPECGQSFSPDADGWHE